MNKGLSIKENVKNTSLSQALSCCQTVLIGNRQAIVDCAKGIMHYSCECVKLDLGKIYMTFSGSGLTIRALCEDKIIVDGEIMRVDFSSGEAKC